MKILVGEFITESNANIPQKCEISNYKMLFGDDCIQALHVADVFEQAGFELIPSVVADAGAAGVIKKDTFDYIESCFVRTVKEHIHEIDGMFLMLHGASGWRALVPATTTFWLRSARWWGRTCPSLWCVTPTAICARNMPRPPL